LKAEPKQIMSTAQYTAKAIVLSSWMTDKQQKVTNATSIFARKNAIDLFVPLRRAIDNIEVNNPELARRICKLIPSQCPFARDIKLFGSTILTIPPMCKLNPLYNELISLRFRALCYLADVCGEDISA
jgi:hypothetical protein